MSGKRPNGDNSIYQYDDRWFVQGMVHGVRRKVGRKTQTAAIAAWKELLKTPAPVEPHTAPRTVEEAVNEWFTLRESNWTYKTTVTYRTALDRQIIPLLGTTNVPALTTRHIDLWQRDLLATGLSSSTVRQARILLKQAMDMQVRHGLLIVNPVLGSLAPPRRQRTSQHLTLEEARSVISSAPDTQSRARLLLGLSTGMRQGEILALAWDHIDLTSSHPTLTVVGTLQRHTGVGLVTTQPKTKGSRRTLSLDPEHVDVLRLLRTEQNHQRLASGFDFNPGRHVFTTPRGTPIDPANDRKHWLKWLADAGVRVVTVHAARHTAATLMLSEGQDLLRVQLTLGHSSIRTTVDVYGHLASGDGASATAAVTAALTA